MSEPRVLAVVLNWRTPELTVECVQHLMAMDDQPLDILVIDNGSGDGSAEVMGGLLPGVEIAALAENLGFSGGVNFGLRQALKDGYDYCLLINNDAFPEAGVLPALLAQAAADIALLSPKILYESAPERIWFAGAEQDKKLLSLRERGQGELDGPEWQQSRDVDYLLGTCLLVNLEATRQVGLLDDRFFMYFEDLDWSLRFRENGYRLRLVAEARVYHRVAMSTGGTDSPARQYHLARSGVLFYAKHAGKGSALQILLFRLASAVKTVLIFVLKGQPRSAQAYLRGLRDGWRLGDG